MGCVKKRLKEVTVTITAQEHLRMDWYVDFTESTFESFFAELTRTMKAGGVTLKRIELPDIVIQISSYADLLNCVKVSSDNSMGNHCIGHIIGKSENLNIFEDIETAVRRIAFAPETIAPAGEFRKVCHNCGCGC